MTRALVGASASNALLGVARVHFRFLWREVQVVDDVLLRRTCDPP